MNKIFDLVRLTHNRQTFEFALQPKGHGTAKLAAAVDGAAFSDDIDAPARIDPDLAQVGLAKFVGSRDEWTAQELVEAIRLHGGLEPIIDDGRAVMRRLDFEGWVVRLGA